MGLPAAVLLALCAASGPIEVLRRDYDALLASGRDGSDAAVEALARWPEEDLRVVVSDLKERASRHAGADREAVLGAAYLHTRTAFAFAAARRPAPGEAHLGLARDLADAGGSRTFDCSWWLAVAYHHGAASDVLRAADSYVQADRKCGDLPELALAHGALSEFLFSFASDGAGWPSIYGKPQGRSRNLGQYTDNALTRKLLEPGHDDQGALAAGYYRRALKGDPALAEARLRLAHLMQLTDRGSEAGRELQALLDASRDPRIRYLAHLFLARLFETKDRASAEQHYREAMRIGPTASSAAMGLARLSFAAGEAGAARDALLPYLRRDPSADVTDPWLVYSAGMPMGGLARALERLRREAGGAP
jgi:tetratricopeptide (TPR) repeat protein